MTTRGDIANESNRKLYQNHLASMAKLREARLRIELLEKGLCDILILDDPMLMRMIAKACLTGAIDDEGKYCFVPPVALGDANGKP